jgi:hypothetical protein
VFPEGKHLMRVNHIGKECYLTLEEVNQAGAKEIGQWQRDPNKLLDYLNQLKTNNLIMVIESAHNDEQCPITAHATTALNVRDTWVIKDHRSIAEMDDKAELNALMESAINTRFYAWRRVPGHNTEDFKAGVIKLKADEQQGEDE